MKLQVVWLGSFLDNEIIHSRLVHEKKQNVSLRLFSNWLFQKII
jgi:hypothetical protein